MTTMKADSRNLVYRERNPGKGTVSSSRSALAGLAGLLLAGVLVGCGEPTPAERMEDRADDIGDSLDEAARDAGDAARDAMGDDRSEIERMRDDAVEAAEHAGDEAADMMDHAGDAADDMMDDAEETAEEARRRMSESINN